VRDGVVYGTAEVGAPAPGQADLVMDLYEPPGPAEGARPVVVLVHGGGFTMQSRKDAGIVRIARGLAEEGVVVASIDYRLLGQQPVASARVRPLEAGLSGYPTATGMVTAVDDTLTAIDYLRAHASELGIDMDRLGLAGSSAGAITVDHVAYVLDDYGIAAPKIRFVDSLCGGIFATQPGPAGTAAVDQVDAGEPALFAEHGDADTTLPVKLDDDLVARADALQIPTEYHRIPGGQHGYQGSRFFTEKVEGDQTPFDRLLAFAADHLR
jgi:acetyl esterase/lipase